MAKTRAEVFAANVRALLKAKGLNSKQAAMQWGFGEKKAFLIRHWASRGIDHPSKKTKLYLELLAKAFGRWHIDQLWEPWPTEFRPKNIVEQLKAELESMDSWHRTWLLVELRKIVTSHRKVFEESRRLRRAAYEEATKDELPLPSLPPVPAGSSFLQAILNKHRAGGSQPVAEVKTEANPVAPKPTSVPSPSERRKAILESLKKNIHTKLSDKEEKEINKLLGNDTEDVGVMPENGGWTLGNKDASKPKSKELNVTLTRTREWLSDTKVPGTFQTYFDRLNQLLGGADKVDGQIRQVLGDNKNDLKAAIEAMKAVVRKSENPGSHLK